MLHFLELYIAFFATQKMQYFTSLSYFLNVFGQWSQYWLNVLIRDMINTYLDFTHKYFEKGAHI